MVSVKIKYPGVRTKLCIYENMAKEVNVVNTQNTDFKCTQKLK